MKIVSFNIRGDFGVDGANNFDHRKPLILQRIRTSAPDIVGFQAVMPHMAAWLQESFPAYTVVGCGRGADLQGEQMTVMFRRDRFSLLEMQTFWLSPTPHVPGSRFAEQSHCPRTATALLLLENATGRAFRVVNTHLDHEGSLARQLGLQQVLTHIDHAALLPDVPVVLMGDFNAPPDSPELAVMADFPGYVHATANLGTTFHAFMADPDGPQIDYIFLRDFQTVSKAEKWQDTNGPVCLSDHYPVCVDAQL